MIKKEQRHLNWITISAGLGFAAVALGAFGAHALKGVLSEAHMHVFQTAVLYHFIHTLALFGFGILKRIKPEIKAWPGYCFLLGILLFSGSLYALVLTQINGLGAITPLGGVLFLAGWIGIGIEANKK